VVNLVSQLNTLLREADGKPFISRITVDEASLKRNFAAQGDAILAEPIYIALQMAGYEGDAHELVNHIAMPHAGQHGVSLLEATQWALAQEKADHVWRKIPPETISMLGKPETYTGAAAVKAREVATSAEAYLKAQSSR
jgi:adenylosuccinate lyase